MTECLEIRLFYASKTARGMNNRPVTCANAIVFDTTKYTDHDHCPSRVNRVSSFKRKWAHVIEYNQSGRKEKPMDSAGLLRAKATLNES